ncbi:hypothetical protein ACQ4WQ_17745 [Janthinobacterium sp. GB1R12]|uniref:hypothetical protein n=1 Tax=Janthinobacterium sp. GB1R12 TaxID=3424190 RepID=UPI003F23715C
MKTLQKISATAAMLIIGGCGGGGSNSNAGPSTPPATVTPPVTATPTNVTNILTGIAAPGVATQTIRGTAYVGASVTAYSVQADGSSGAALGAPATADINGQFVITATAAPLGPVRLVAVGGTIARAADNSIQPGGSLELITPFVTTEYNNFKISPLTDIAANAMASSARSGATLANAFVEGMQRLLELDVANVVFLQDKSVYLNVLKGAVKSDTTNYGAQSLQGQELLNGLEYLGVMLDLPAQAVVKAVGAAAQSSYALANVDGTGMPISVGTWANNTFSPSATMPLKALRDAKTPEAQKVAGTVAGTKVAPRLNEYVSRYLVMDFVMDTACRSNASLYFTSRYPFYQVDAQGKMFAADCSAAAQRIAELKARVATNNSTRMK